MRLCTRVKDDNNDVCLADAMKRGGTPKGPVVSWHGFGESPLPMPSLGYEASLMTLYFSSHLSLSEGGGRYVTGRKKENENQ